VPVTCYDDIGDDDEHAMDKETTEDMLTDSAIDGLHSLDAITIRFELGGKKLPCGICVSRENNPDPEEDYVHCKVARHRRDCHGDHPQVKECEDIIVEKRAELKLRPRNLVKLRTLNRRLKLLNTMLGHRGSYLHNVKVLKATKGKHFHV
jgi:hypothetical protein